MGRKYYAVRRGRERGLYNSWAECKLQVLNYPECEYQSFTRKSLAEAYLAQAVVENANAVPQKTSDKTVYQLEYDGASKGNPGRAGAGAVLRQPDGTVVQELTMGLGVATNNFAEYQGLLLGLKAALERSISCIQVQGDSKLVSKQVMGEWAVRSENLAPLHAEVQALVKQFSDFSIRHVRRELNAAADALANKGVLKCLEVPGTVVLETSTSETKGVDLVNEEITSASKKKPARAKKEDLLYRLEYDGASKGNPGKAGAGALLRDPAGSVVEELTIGLGVATSNVAEYEGLILGLQAAVNRRITRIQVQGDSNLICKQVEGKWAVKNEKLVPLHARAQALSKQFREFSIRHVQRELNSAADNLANMAVHAQCRETIQEPLGRRLDFAETQTPTISLQRQLDVDLQNMAIEKQAAIQLEQESLPVADAEPLKKAVSRRKKVISEQTDETEKRGKKKTKTEEEVLVYQVEYDGASKGNPGRAGAAALIRHPNGSVIQELTMGLGFTTNNVAEYRALILGLKAALDRNLTRIQVLGDSSLVCKQVAGEWAVNNKTLVILHAEARALASKFERFSIHHIERELNAAADALANRATRLKWKEVKSKPALMNAVSDEDFEENRETVVERVPTKLRRATSLLGAPSTGITPGLLASRHKLVIGSASLQAACSSYRGLHCLRVTRPSFTGHLPRMCISTLAVFAAI